MIIFCFMKVMAVKRKRCTQFGEKIDLKGMILQGLFSEKF